MGVLNFPVIKKEFIIDYGQYFTKIDIKIDEKMKEKITRNLYYYSYGGGMVFLN